MTSLDSLLSQPPVIRAGWTLVHFLWQGSAIAIVLAVVRGAAGSWLGARARYSLSCLALALMCAAPPLTFLALGAIDPSAAPRPVWQISAPGMWDRILPWVVVGWFLGVVLFSARVFAGWRKAVRVRNAAAEPPTREWQQALESLMRRMKVSAPVRLVMSPLATAPAVVGWLKPVILLPVEAMTGLPLEQVQSLLAHELAHIRRNDYLVNILQSIAESLLFYHPAVWWISGQIRAERELCCDDLAVETSEDVLTYATALAALETFRRSHLKTAMAADGGSLLTRIRRLAGDANSQPHSLPGPGAAWVLAILWLAGAGAVVMHASQAQPIRALRPFIAPGIAATPPMRFETPPVAVPRTAPLLSALLFNPFLALPQTAASSPAASEEEKRLASIEGTVFNTAGKPVANATVRLVAANTGALTQLVNLPAGAMVLQTSVASPPATRTDAEGKFSLERVPPGSYTIQLHHKDYLAATYGVRPGIQDGGTVLTLDEGRRVTGIGIKLPEPATIVGRVVDADGDPLANMSVNAQVKRYYYPQSRGQVYATTISGDNGEFRLTVAPGRYYIVANKRVTWTVNDRAPIVAAKPGQKILVPGTTYWGGADNFKKATPVDIGAGETLNLGEYKIADQPLVHVRGKVVGDPELLKGARVTRVPPPNSSLCWSCGSDIDTDGVFDMPNMYPYDFTIGVYSQKYGFVGWTDLVVEQADVDNVIITAAAAPLSGSIIVEEATAGAQSPPMPSRIELSSTGYYKVTTTASIKPDGTFAFVAVAPGTYFFNVIGVPRGSYVKTARLNGRSCLTEPMDWNGSAGPLEITLSSKSPVLEGSVVDAEGKPVPGTVTLVPNPQRPGFPLLYPVAKADQQGRFRIESAAPGSYRVFAWANIPDMAHGVPNFIEPFLDAGEKIELKEGGRETVLLKRISVDSMEATLKRAGR